MQVFWTTNTTVCFAQAEAQFAIRKITEDDTKYMATGKYVAIKRFLAGAYERLSECDRASALVNLQGLGDSTPSELIDYMLCSHRWSHTVFWFLHLIMQQLPDYVRAPLSLSGIKDCRSLSQEADRIYLSGRPPIEEVNIPKQSAKPNSKQHSDHCWYHQGFGKNARRCSPNCKHYVKNQGNGSQGQR